jgi:hypothetical protein
MGERTNNGSIVNISSLHFAPLALCLLWAVPTNGETAETDPRPEEKILLLPMAHEPENAALAATFTELISTHFQAEKPFALYGTEWLESQNLGPEVVADETCQKSECLDELAQTVEIRGIIYGSVLSTANQWTWEIRIFDADKSRIIAKVEASGTSPELLAPEAPGLIRELMGQLDPRPLPPPPVEKTLWESPLFISGLALTGASTMVLVGAAGYVIDAELKLATPEIHRDLKAEALLYGKNGVWVGAASLVGIAGGLALTGAGIMFYE